MKKLALKKTCIGTLTNIPRGCSIVVVFTVITALIILQSCAAFFDDLTGSANDTELLPTGVTFFAVVQPDGNVYTYDVCQKQLTQLTSDGQPYRGSISEAGSYYLFGTSAAWSPDGSKLLVGKDSVAYVIDLESGSQISVGERILLASWSPDGRNIAMVQPLTDDYQYWKTEHNRISVIDAQDFSKKLFFEGTAPVWMSDSELIYFSITSTEDSYILSDVIKINLVGDHQTLCPQVRTRVSPVDYARLSANKKYAAAYSGSEPNLAVFSLDQPDTISTEWLVGSRENVSRWSPTRPVLAICTAGEGGKDGPLPETSGGAVLLIEPNQPPKVFNDRRCLAWSHVSWHPSGKFVAFLDLNQKLVFIDTVTNEYIDRPVQPDTLKMYEGPWWSPSGHYIGVISGSKVYVAPFEKELAFEYVTDGVEIAWQPLKN